MRTVLAQVVTVEEALLGAVMVRVGKREDGMALSNGSALLKGLAVSLRVVWFCFAGAVASGLVSVGTALARAMTVEVALLVAVVVARVID